MVGRGLDANLALNCAVKPLPHPRIVGRNDQGGVDALRQPKSAVGNALERVSRHSPSDSSPVLSQRDMPPKRSPAHYPWAVLIARIYEVFPLLCPRCGGQMRLIAFVIEGTQIKKLRHGYFVEVGRILQDWRYVAQQTDGRTANSSHST